jgi:hypothetical protein
MGVEMAVTCPPEDDKLHSGIRGELGAISDRKNGGDSNLIKVSKVGGSLNGRTHDQRTQSMRGGH